MRIVLAIKSSELLSVRSWFFQVGILECNEFGLVLLLISVSTSDLFLLCVGSLYRVRMRMTHSRSGWCVFKTLKEFCRMNLH